MAENYSPATSDYAPKDDDVIVDRELRSIIEITTKRLGFATANTIPTLQALAGRIARSKGFVNATVLEDAALIHSEVSELTEDFRDRGCGLLHPIGGVFPYWYERKFGDCPQEQASFIGRETGLPNKPRGIASELADIVIRCLHFADKHDIDLLEAIREKMLYNAHRPHMHGGKKL